MFYKKRIFKKSKTLIKLKYNTFAGGINADVDPNIMSVKNATVSYNFMYDTGALKQGYGVDTVKVPLTSGVEADLINTYTPVDFLGAFPYRNYNSSTGTYQNIVLLYGSDNNLYWFSVSPDLVPVLTKISCSVFTTCPTASINYRLNSRDVIIFTSSTDGMVLFNSVAAPSAVSTAPKITSMCLHYERLFATVDGEKNTVWYSDDLDPTNWTVGGNDAGFIQMIDERGCLNKVISFKDYVYVFRDYGITRITAYADETEFSVAHLFLSSSKIHSNTVCVCGDYVLFLTDNGLYSFNGITTTRLSIPIESMLKGVDCTYARACYYNGKYFLALKLNYTDDPILDETRTGGCVNNTLLVVDIEKGGFTLTRGIDISALCPVLMDETTKLVVCMRGTNSTKVGQLSTSGKYFSTNIPKAWVSPKNDLGYPDKDKLIKDIYVKCQYACSLRVRTDDKTKTYILKVGDNRIRVNLKTKNIAIDFFSNSDLAYISPPEIFIGLV